MGNFFLELFDAFEPLLFIVFCCVAVWFIISVTRLFLSLWPKSKNLDTMIIFLSAVFLSLGILLYTLYNLADFYVRVLGYYKFFYFIFGLSFLFFILEMFDTLFSISWKYDAVWINNKSALAVIVGGIIGGMLIYSGTNIGEGPGVGCVIFTLTLGVPVWYVAGILVNYFTDIFEDIVVERRLDSGLRFSAFLVASGLILGRANAGDWTSFNDTITEFMVFWPLIPLFAIFVGLEKFYFSKRLMKDRLTMTIIYMLVLVVFAIIVVYLSLPLPINPFYHPFNFR